MVAGYLQTLLPFFALASGIDWKNGKDAVIKYWKEQTVRNLMVVVSNDLLKFATSSDRALFNGCLRYSNIENIYHYSRCMGPLIRKNRERSNKNLDFSPKITRFERNLKDSPAIDQNSYQPDFTDLNSYQSQQQPDFVDLNSYQSRQQPNFVDLNSYQSRRQRDFVDPDDDP